MMKHKRSFLCCMVLLLGIVLLRPGKAGPVQAQTTSSLQPGVLTDGYLDAGQVQNWAFNATAGQVMMATVIKYNSSLDPYLSLQDATGSTLTENDDFANTAAALIGPVVLASAGEYYLTVQGATSDTSGGYEILVSLADSPRLPDIGSSDYLQQGQALLELGYGEKAVAAFEQAIQLDSQSAAAYRGRAQAYLQIEAFEQAQIDAGTAFDLDPNDAETVFTLAAAYLALGHEKQAEDNLAYGLTLDSNSAYGYSLQGELALKRANYVAAVDALSSAITIAPDSAMYLSRARAYLGLELYTEAALDVVSAFDLAQNSPRCFVDIGLLLYDQYAFGQAGSAFAVALQIDPKFEAALFRQGITLYYDNPTQAMQLFGSLIDQHSRFADQAALWQGYIQYYQFYDLDAAKSAYQTAIQLNPNSSDAYVQLASLSMDNSEYETGLDYINQAIQIDPDNDWAYYTRGSLYDQLGQTTFAAADYQQALTLNPQNYTAIYQLADALERLHRFLEARQLYARLIKQGNTHGDVPSEFVSDAQSRFDQLTDSVCSVQASSELTTWKGPGTTYPAAGVLQVDTPYDVRARVQTSDGSTWWWLINGAWIKSDSVVEGSACDTVTNASFVADSGAASTNTMTDVTPPATQCLVEFTSNGNVRTGPGTDYPVLRQGTTGEIAEAIAQETGGDGYTWWQLTDAGWIRSDLVNAGKTCSNLPNSSSAQQPEPQPTAASPTANTYQSNPDAPEIIYVMVYNSPDDFDTLIQEVYFVDPTGDADHVDYTIVRATRDGLNVGGGDFDISSEEQQLGTYLQGQWGCGGSYEVTIRVTISDNAGNISNSIDYTMYCGQDNSSVFEE